MKVKQKELNVDFIGGQKTPLTEDEKLAISRFIRESKERKATVKSMLSQKGGKRGRVTSASKSVN